MVIFWNDGTSLYHYGIPGMKWGIRNGPPYPLGTEQKTKREKKKDYQDTYYEKSKKSVMTIKQKKESIKNALKRSDEAYSKLHKLQSKQYEDATNTINTKIAKETKFKTFEELEDAAMREDPSTPYEDSLWNKVNIYEFEFYDLLNAKNDEIDKAAQEWDRIAKDFVEDWVNKNGSLRYDESITDFSPKTYNHEHQMWYSDVETLIDHYTDNDYYKWQISNDGVWEIVKVK